MKRNMGGRDAADWREATLARMRALILEADPAIIEERKWKKASNAMAGVPVWSHHGIVCTGEAYTKVVKLTFARGATIPDPSRLFNSSLEGNTRRAIDIHEGEKKVHAGATPDIEGRRRSSPISRTIETAEPSEAGRRIRDTALPSAVFHVEFGLI